MKKAVFILLSLVCALCAACTSNAGQQSSNDQQYAGPVPVRRSLYHNPDSLAYYAALAYKDEDPQGLFVTGVAAWLRRLDEHFPDSVTTVSFEEADIMLLRAAQLGHQDAIRAIHCLDSAGLWHHSLPEDLEK